MIVDTSAIVAIALEEPGAEALKEALALSTGDDFIRTDIQPAVFTGRE